MFNTQIQLGSLGYLDLSENVPVPLNYGIAEIRDISKRRGSFSKTIQLPGTVNNNTLLGNLFNVNVADSSFNINLKQECIILQNGVPVMEGSLQLVSVNKINPSDGTLDEQVTYSVLVKDSSSDFFSTMQDKRLEDLDGFSQYNHIYTLTGVTATSAHTVDDAYTYFLPFKASPFYGIQDFAPAIYAKKYWDEIFAQNGYSYTWDSLEECSFDKLIIPYNGDTPQVNNNFYNFRAGFETGSTESFVISAQTLSSLLGVGSITEPLIFDDEVTSPNFDNGGNYEATVAEYTSPIVGEVEFRLRYKYQVSLTVPINCTLTNSTAVPKFNLRLSNVTKLDNSIDFSSVFLGPDLYAAPIGQNINFSAGTSVIIDEICDTTSVFPIDIGQIVAPFLRADLLYQGVWFVSGSTTPLTQSEIPYFTITRRIDVEDYDNNFFTNRFSGDLNEGQTVEVDKFIPKNIKQKEFIKGITTLYNLYITPDEENTNNLIIQTRNDYYDSGDIRDWTSKLNIQDSINIDFLPDLQDKRLTLTYKQDKDGWNEQYQLATGEVYGQAQYTFENEFTQSEKKIETIFSPTPIVPNAGGLLVPAIVSKAPKNNIRILYYDGWKQGSWTFGKITPLNPSGFSETFLSYPRALHLDDPINPTLSINFLQPDYYGYSNFETVTNNNLYNRYWSRFVNQIETGKLMTARFKLDEVDINTLDLKDRIWVQDSYWNINRIIDYNANGNGLTTVELISVDEGLKFEATSFNRNDEASGVVDVGPKNNWINNLESIKASDSQNTFGTSVFNTQVLGDGNIIQGGSNSSIVIGDGNNYNGRYGIVAGQDNNVQGDFFYVFGGSGQTYSGSSQAIFEVPVSAQTINVEQIFIGGSDIPIDEPPVWAEGTGAVAGYAIKALNDSTTDATGDYAVAEGFNTLASGDYCHAQGNGSIAGGFASHAGGNESSTNLDGEFASSCTSLGAVGQTQFGMFDGFTSTVDATPSLLDFLNAGLGVNGWRPSFAATGSAYCNFKYQMVCYNLTTNDARLISGEGLIKWVSGTPTLVFASTPTNNGDAGLAAVTATPVASGNGLQFQVTGIAATNLVWRVRVDYNF